MKRLINKKRYLLTAMLVFLLTTMLAACGGTADKGSSAGSAPPDKGSAPAAGSVTAPKDFHIDVSRIDGSTATIPLMQATMKALYGTSDGVAFNRTDGAYWNLNNKDKDVIFVTEPSEQNLADAAAAGVELEVIPVVKDALVFLLNSANPLDGLTQQQIQDIYTGKITNWREAGGADAAIIPFQRPVGSGSQTLFLDLAMKGKAPMDAPTEIRPADMGGLIDKVAAYENKAGAIGYSVFYYATDMYQRNEVKLLKVDGVMPTKETIADGSYPYPTYYYAVIRKDEPKDSPARALINWMLSDEGQRVAAAAGYVPMSPKNAEAAPDGYGFYGSTPENTTQSNGTGGSKPLPLPEAAVPGSPDPLPLGKDVKLSDLFYDGVNYIAYINKSISDQSEASDPWYFVEMSRPFTGVPNDYPLFDLIPPAGNYQGDSFGAILQIRFAPDNPFFATPGMVDPTYDIPFLINLPQDLSPYGSVWKVDYIKKESPRHTGVMVPKITAAYLKPSGTDKKLNAGILARYEKAEAAGAFDGINSFPVSQTIDPYLQEINGKLTITYPLDGGDNPRDPISFAFDLRTGEEIALPVFDTVTASGTRAPMGANRYDPGLATDGDQTTAWAEGAPGPGVGEWIELRAGAKQRVDSISLINGYTKSDQAYQDNNRVKTCTITAEGGFTMQVPLADNNQWYQDIPLKTPLYTSWLRFTITDVYPGAGDSEDTLISEIRVQ